MKQQSEWQFPWRGGTVRARLFVPPQWQSGLLLYCNGFAEETDALRAALCGPQSGAEETDAPARQNAGRALAAGQEPRPAPAVSAVPDAALVLLDGFDWDRDLTPWPAPRAFRTGQDFGGGAADYLAFLLGTVLTTVEAELSFAAAAQPGSAPVPPLRRGILGYSLAGLFAVYAVSGSARFWCGASVSGSLWYDDFLEYLQKRMQPQRGAGEVPLPRRFYLSLGDREAHTRSPRMARVEQCTRQTEALLRAAGTETRWETNPGGHFNDPAGRMARAVRWLAQREDLQGS